MPAVKRVQRNPSVIRLDPPKSYTHEEELRLIERHGIRSKDLAFVYFVREPLAGHIKIGVAKDVSARLETLQCAHPAELRVIGICDGGRTQEVALHKEFAHLRLRSEWFSAHETLIARAKELCGRRFNFEHGLIFRPWPAK